MFLLKNAYPTYPHQWMKKGAFSTFVNSQTGKRIAPVIWVVPMVVLSAGFCFPLRHKRCEPVVPFKNWAVFTLPIKKPGAAGFLCCGHKLCAYGYAFW